MNGKGGFGMTEKRFELAYEQGDWWAVRDGDTTLWKEEVVALLNELVEENEQLQKESIFLAKQRNYWKGKCDRAVETFDVDEATAIKIRELEKENEQLKQKLELLDLNRKNDTIKMIDGKVFIRM